MSDDELIEAIAKEFSTFCKNQLSSMRDRADQVELVDTFLSGRSDTDHSAPNYAALRKRLIIELRQISDSAELTVPDAASTAVEGVEGASLGAAEGFPPLPDHVESGPNSEVGLPLPSRYDSIAKIGEGGLGQIWRVRDQKLRRVVAVKSLREQWFAKPDAWQRLTREAELAGKLQHPGVPPLYDSGSLDNGVPFFSMKVVEGKTLAELIREAGSTGKPTQQQLLGYFASVAQTIAYAHEQGVIHRDLKPQNVMVGEFGEVQVMDWGLAKHIGEPELGVVECEVEGGVGTVENEGVESAASLAASMTGAGDVLGTPSYMPPEQALGQRDRIDQRSDVYSLGAMLFELLTGQRLFSEISSADKVLAAVAASELEPSLKMLRDCDADETLKELTRRCLFADPVQRPSGGGAVAAEVAAYVERREQRLQEAKDEQARAELRIEEEQKRRRIALGLVGVLAAGVLGTAFGLYRAQTQWTRAEDNAVEAINNEKLAVANALAAEKNAEQAAENAKRAEANADMAEENAIAAEKVVQDFYSRVSEEKLFDTPSLQPLRQEFLDSALEFYEARLKESPDHPRIQYAHGELLYRSANATMTRGELTSAYELNERAIKQLEDLQELTDAEADSGDDAPDYRQWAGPLLGRAYLLRGVAMMRMGQGPACIQWYEKSEGLLKAAAEDESSNVKAKRYLGELYGAWGELMASSPQPAMGMPLIQKAKKVREAILDADDANEYDTYSFARTIWDLGLCQRRMSSRVSSVVEWDDLLNKALENYAQAATMLEKLTAEHPESLAFMMTLGDVYNTIAVAHSHRNDRGGRPEAERMQNYENALAAYEKSMAIQQRLVNENPGIARLENNLGRAFLGLSTQYKFLSRLEESEEAGIKAVEIRRRLAEKNPQSRQYVEGLANALNGLGLLQLKMDKPDAALSVFQEAEKSYRGLVAELEGNERLLGNLSMMITNVGLARQKLGEFEVASEKMLEAVQTNPGQPDRLYTIARCQGRLVSEAAEAGVEQSQIDSLMQQVVQTLRSLEAIDFLSEDDLSDEAFKALEGNMDYDAMLQSVKSAGVEPAEVGQP